MIVIVLMGILAAIAIPSWFGLIESRNVESAANQMVSDMRLSHSRASNQLTDWRVVFRLNGNQVTCGATTADYCLVKLSTVFPTTPTPTVSQSIPKQLPGGTRFLSTNIGTDNTTPAIVGMSTDADRRTIEFNSDGTARSLNTTSPGYTVSPGDPQPTIRVSSDDGDAVFRITIAPATSKVEVE